MGNRLSVLSGSEKAALEKPEVKERALELFKQQHPAEAWKYNQYEVFAYHDPQTAAECRYLAYYSMKWSNRNEELKEREEVDRAKKEKRASLKSEGRGSGLGWWRDLSTRKRGRDDDENEANQHEPRLDTRRKRIKWDGEEEGTTLRGFDRMRNRRSQAERTTDSSQRSVFGDWKTQSNEPEPPEVPLSHELSKEMDQAFHLNLKY